MAQAGKIPSTLRRPFHQGKPKHIALNFATDLSITLDKIPAEIPYKNINQQLINDKQENIENDTVEFKGNRNTTT